MRTIREAFGLTEEDCGKEELEDILRCIQEKEMEAQEQSSPSAILVVLGIYIYCTLKGRPINSNGGNECLPQA